MVVGVGDGLRVWPGCDGLLKPLQVVAVVRGDVAGQVRDAVTLSRAERVHSTQREKLLSSLPGQDQSLPGRSCAAVQVQ